jgi:hypothetical protein
MPVSKSGSKNPMNRSGSFTDKKAEKYSKMGSLESRIEEESHKDKKKDIILEEMDQSSKNSYASSEHNLSSPDV